MAIMSSSGAANANGAASRRPFRFSIIVHREIFMLLTIGTFIKDGTDFVGHIAMLTFQEKAVILPNLSKRGKRSPDYRVYANGVQIGEARKAFEEDGTHYLSVVLDDPCLAHPISCRLLHDGCGQYRLVWSR
jgi:uncharacterized protein (DUF736 family)